MSRHTNHIDRWVGQFDKFGFNNEAQVIILNEMERILNTYYISYRKAQAFISKALTSQSLFGTNPAEAIFNFCEFKQRAAVKMIY